MSYITHGDEQDTACLAGIEYGNDVRMVDAGCCSGLAHEPLPEGLVLAELGGQDLQRDQAPEAQVERAVDDSHAAAADALLDLVSGELLARSEITGPGMNVLCHC